MLFFYILIFFTYYIYKKNYSNVNLIKIFCIKILKILNYDITEPDLLKLPSKLVIISSHTSIYDFFMGLLFYYGYLSTKYSGHILMKKNFEIICTPILKFFDKNIKLISIDNKKSGITNKICYNLNDKDNYILFLAPEGTRKCTSKLRSGYWYICKNLDINVLYIGIDFSEKKIILEDFRKVKNSWDEEQLEFINSCKKYVPLYPERCYWNKDYYNK